MKKTIATFPQRSVALSLDRPNYVVTFPGDGFSIDIKITHAPPTCSFGTGLDFELSPMAVFTLMDGNGQRIYTTSPASAVPYIDIRDDGTATVDTTWEMVVNSVAFQALFWENGISPEQRQKVFIAIAAIRSAVYKTQPNTNFNASVDFTVLGNIADVAKLGTYYHLMESNRYPNSVWLKRRVIRNPVLMTSLPYSQKPIVNSGYSIESRWSFVYKGEMHKEGQKEVKTTFTFVDDLFVQPKSLSDVMTMLEG